MSNPVSSQQAFRALVRQTFQTCSPRATRTFSITACRLVSPCAARSASTEPPSSHLPADNEYVPFDKNSNSPSSILSSKKSPISRSSANQVATRTPKSPIRKPTHRPFSNPIPNPRFNDPPTPEEPAWRAHKRAVAQKLNSAPWNPHKKLSPDALEGIRALHAQYPDHFTTPVLAAQFEVSPDAIRRILKGKWRPSAAEEEARLARWERRGERAWRVLSETKGVHPPRRWREKGIGKGIPRRPSPQQWEKILHNKEERRAAINRPQQKSAGQVPRARSWVEPRLQ